MVKSHMGAGWGRQNRQGNLSPQKPLNSLSISLDLAERLSSHIIPQLALHGAGMGPCGVCSNAQSTSRDRDFGAWHAWGREKIKQSTPGTFWRGRQGNGAVGWRGACNASWAEDTYLQRNVNPDCGSFQHFFNIASWQGELQIMMGMPALLRRSTSMRQ